MRNGCHRGHVSIWWEIRRLGYVGVGGIVAGEMRMAPTNPVPDEDWQVGPGLQAGQRVVRQLVYLNGV
ncbi:unnamed protein product, partial [Ectocarpus sp. 12 AP-2014]